MIRYDLKCTNGHAFDSWFGSSADYNKLKAAGMVACSVCGETDVEKAVMAPRVSTTDDHPLSAPTTAAEHMVRELRKEIEKNADNVGKEFANEARKIHAGDAPERAIYGEAKPDEAVALIEDGIPVTPLPWSSRKTN